MYFNYSNIKKFKSKNIYQNNNTFKITLIMNKNKTFYIKYYFK